MTSVQSAPDVSAQNSARPQPVNPIVVIGAIGLAAEVIDGLAEGDTVVVHPSDKVTDGVEVIRR